MRWWLVAVALSIAAPSAAASPRVHLQWSAPLGSMCPTAATLDEDVEQLTGQGFVSAAEAEVHVVGRVDRSELELIAHIEAHTADGAPLGTRELRASVDDCASLRKPLAMVLALLVDQPLEPSPGLKYALGVEVAAVTALLPRATGSVGLLAFVAPLPWLKLRAQLSYLWPVVAETDSGAGARLSAFGGALALCPRLIKAADAALWLCAGAQSGAIVAAPHGLVEHATQKVAFADGVAELAGSLRVYRGATLWLSAGPTLALVRPELYLDRANGSRVTVQHAAQVGAIFRLGLTIGRP